MKFELNNGALTLFLEGHIDTQNAPRIKNEIEEILAENRFDALLIDCEKLTYISSTGLRILLSLRKRLGALKVFNVSTDVYEILDMTGFTQLMDVEKAYRIFDITGCELIGEGANGKVYRATNDTIVKVYKNPDSLKDIKRERELSRTAFLLGIPTAIPFDVVKVGETYGSVFELLDARGFDELIRDEGNIEFIAQESMAIAKIIHSTEAPADLPKQRDISLSWAETVKPYFTKEENEKLVKLIYDLPETGTLLHGDLHVKNMMRQKDETLLIDMDTLTEGHPIYELAFMYNAYKGFGIVDPAEVSDFLGVSIEVAYRVFRRSLEVYLGTTDENRLNEVEEKAELIGMLRIMRRVLKYTSLEKAVDDAMFKATHDRLAELLTKVDTLEF